ncbi:MAG TPA: DUF1365 domain-containing protein [Caulobacteraceae bacterium]
MSQASGLYDGVVTHERLAPRRHRLRYRLFQLLIDLDEAAGLGERLKLFGHNRFALFSLHERDHLAGDGRPLWVQVEALLATAGIDIAGGRVRLLCMPRVLGYVFNPLSIFYCHRASGELAAVLLEVNNTFGERHTYLIEVPTGAKLVRQTCAKAFFVSPFMGLDMTYDFRLSLPTDSVVTAILGRGADGVPIITATFSGARREVDDRALAHAFFSHPLLTLKVVGAIHWEALKLLAKGVRLRTKPAPPPHPVTVVRSELAAPAGQEPQPDRRAGHVALVRSRGRLQAQQAEVAEALVGEEPQVELTA